MFIYSHNKTLEQNKATTALHKILHRYKKNGIPYGIPSLPNNRNMIITCTFFLRTQRF